MLSKRSITQVGISVLVSAIFGNVLVADAAAQGEKDVRLADAAMQDDKDGVRSLLKEKADVNAAQGDGMTALHWAAFQDDFEIAEMLLGAGANVNASTRNGALTLLAMACTNGDPALIEALLKAGADANSTTMSGVTALMRAASSGSVDAVKVLLDHGAEVNAKETSHGQTALMFAAAEDRAGVIKLLAAHGADVSTRTDLVELDPIRLSDKESRKGEGLPSTVTGGNAFMGGMTALLFAAREGHLDAVRAMLEAGAGVNEASTGEHSTPLVIAIENGHYEVAKLLVDHGADPNLATADGLAALYATIDMQYAGFAWTPIPITSQEKVTYLDLMKVVLEHGANPNARLKRKLWFRPLTHDSQWIDPAGATPFWRAAQATDVAAMRLLVAHGADPKLTSTNGDSGLGMAAGLGWVAGMTENAPDPNSWKESIEYCLELGLDINAPDKQGYTPLMGVAWRGNNDLVSFLVDHGAKLEAKNQRGWSVTDMANGPSLRNGVPRAHPETVAFLLKLGAPPLSAVEGEAILGSRKSRKSATKQQDPPVPSKLEVPAIPR